MSTPAPLPLPPAQRANDINMEEEDEDLTPLHTPVIGESAVGRAAAAAAAVGEGESEGEGEGEDGEGDGDVRMVDVEGEGSGAVEKKKRKRQTGVMQEDRLPGTTTLPVARVQRIVKADKEIQMMNKESIFLLSVATEHFIQRLTEQGYVQARLEGRKAITLKDLTAAIKSHEDLAFLEDIVPATVPLSEALALRQKRAAQDTLPNPEDSLPLSETIPKIPMHPSTNPKYPNALIRRGPNTHGKRIAKGAVGAGATLVEAPLSVQAQGKGKGKAAVQDVGAGTAGLSSPDTPTSANVRQSARQRARKQSIGANANDMEVEGDGDGKGGNDNRDSEELSGEEG